MYLPRNALSSSPITMCALANSNSIEAVVLLDNMNGAFIVCDLHFEIGLVVVYENGK